jgi:hypothetical protein
MFEKGHKHQIELHKVIAGEIRGDDVADRRKGYEASRKGYARWTAP